LINIFLKNKLLKSIIFGLLSFLVVITVYAGLKVTYSVYRIDYLKFDGSQTDISHPLIVVINDINSYNNIINIIPSMTGELPLYNDKEETLILVVMHNKLCLYSYQVSGVYHHIWYFSNFNDENYTINLNKKNISDSNLDNNCNFVGTSIYDYTIIKVKKTNRPFGLKVINS
jgi:hypothetical protein